MAEPDQTTALGLLRHLQEILQDSSSKQTGIATGSLTRTPSENHHRKNPLENHTENRSRIYTKKVSETPIKDLLGIYKRRVLEILTKTCIEIRTEVEIGGMGTPARSATEAVLGLRREGWVHLQGTCPQLESDLNERFHRQ